MITIDSLTKKAAKLLPKRSVNDILSTFNSALADLSKLEKRNRAEFVEKSEKIARLNSENLVLVAEAARAAKVHAKISELVR